MEVGTTNGTVTDLDGNFTLNVRSGATLRISYIGYLTQEVLTGNKDFIDIVLKEDNELLDEVVIVGYGTQKKATLSGSVTSVGGEKLVQAPVTNVSQSLAGRLPGVVAVANTSEPGYDDVTITIRGVNTFGNSAPLVVVDGVPGRSLERIDPATIESMSVLKDASAAIYGAQAANLDMPIGSQLTSSVILFPQTVTALPLYVKYNGERYKATLNIPEGALKAGNNYTYTVKVRNRGIEVSQATIAAWNEIDLGEVGADL